MLKIELTYQQLANCQAGVQKLMYAKGLKPASALKICDSLRGLIEAQNKALPIIQDNHRALVIELGKPVSKSKNADYKVLPENEAEFSDKMKEVMSTSVEVEYCPLDMVDLDGADLTPADFAEIVPLMFLFRD